jgi:anion-transporting  ArsA/GET3 family ATPase
MASVLEHKLLVLTGKGGVGKTTVSAALGLLAADRGLRTIVVEVGDQRRLAELFGVGTEDETEDAGSEIELRQNLWSISIDPDRALLEWLQAIGGRVSGRVLASSGTFQYFAAAAPGAKELVSMVKIWKLTEGERGGRRRPGRYDLVILDAPATGHALGMLHSPQTFGAIARVGPIASQTGQVSELLSDPARSAYLAVAQPTEMAVTEALEIQDGLQRQLGRDLHTVVVNGTLPRRFSAAEISRFDGLAGSDSVTPASANHPVTRSAALAARAVHSRASFQHNQVARLRRRHFEVLPVPFLFVAELDLAAVEWIAEHLSKQL